MTGTITPSSVPRFTLARTVPIHQVSAGPGLGDILAVIEHPRASETPGRVVS